jgi:hypothetical protein
MTAVTQPGFFVRAATALGMLLAIGLSLPLWLTRPTYPAVPLAAFIPSFPSPVDGLFLTFVLGTFVALLWRPKFRRFAALWFAAAGFLVLQDQARLQPWFVEGVLILAAFILSDDESGALNNCRLITAGVYFWSGAHKMNTSFVNALAPWLLSPLTTSMLFVHIVGVAVPFLEMGLGLALLIPGVRRIGVVGIVAMHVFLLTTLGPWALNWNSVVWPWNLMMVVLVPCLFWKTPVSTGEVLALRSRGMQVLLAIFLVVLPALSLGELWDTAPSFDLYSGNALIGSVVMTPEAWQRLDERTRNVAERTTAGYRVLFDDWSLSERNVPAYPAERVLSAVARSFCRIHQTENDFVFLIEKPARWLYRPGWHRVEAAQTICAANSPTYR